jgi:hypothetical protein
MDREKLNIEDAVGSSVKQAANGMSDAAQRLSEKAHETLASAGETLREHLPAGGKMGAAAESVSRGVRQTADYIQKEGMTGMIEDVEVLIRRYPFQTLLLGMGFGYFLSRLRPD